MLPDAPAFERAAFADRIRLPLAFDSARMQADLAEMPDHAWVEHFVTQNYEGAWSILPLRCKADATHPIQMAYADPSATEFKATPWLAQAHYLRSVLDAFDCPLQTARLMRLAPGSVIKPHRDPDLSADLGAARIHIVVGTNPAVDFRLNGTRVVMPPGSCWYLRLADEHAITNGGDCDRVHLVIDCTVNDWLRSQLHSGST
jgi:hypothetical protein